MKTTTAVTTTSTKAGPQPVGPERPGPLKVDHVRGAVTGLPLNEWRAWCAARGTVSTQPLPAPADGDPFGGLDVSAWFPYQRADGSPLPHAARDQLAHACAAHLRLRTDGRRYGYASRVAATAAVLEESYGEALMTELLGSLATVVRSKARKHPWLQERSEALEIAWEATIEAIASFDPTRGTAWDHVTSRIAQACSQSYGPARFPGVKDSLAQDAWRALQYRGDAGTRSPAAIAEMAANAILDDARHKVAATHPDLDPETVEKEAVKNARRNSRLNPMSQEVPAILMAHLIPQESNDDLAGRLPGWQPTDPSADPAWEATGGDGIEVMTTISLLTVPAAAHDCVVTALSGGKLTSDDLPAGVTSAQVKSWVQDAGARLLSPHLQYCHLTGLPTRTVTRTAWEPPQTAGAEDVWA